jgi:release factor glutamine methyltransferase
VLTSGGDAGTAAFAAAYEHATARRVTREPVAYITGHKDFWTLTLAVSNAVLIPRPETEGIIEQVLRRFRDPAQPLEIADACTGSGCVAIALGVEYSSAQITATDISREALAVAAHNMQRYGLGNRMRLVLTDLLTALIGPFDVIVANPPYVPSSERPTIQPEVVFEPATAVYAGEDGLDVIRALIPQAITRLRAGGALIFEFGFGQERTVADLISTFDSLRMDAIASDFSGIPRIAIAIRQ